MKPFTLFSLLTLIVPLSLTAQSQNVIIDDVYFNPSDPAMVQTMKKSGKQIIDNKSRPNYKNGAQEIVYKERTIKYPTIITDTIFVDGKSPDGYAFHNQVVHYPALILLGPDGKEVFRYIGKNNSDRYSFEQLSIKIHELTEK